MSDFFRFPHTPHLAWLGQGLPRDDKLLSPGEIEELLAGDVVVEEKIDGANLGISVGPDGRLRAQNRGAYLPEPYSGQFSRLGSWLGQHAHILTELLGDKLILFGEWCAARHSLDYSALPDWFLLFDVYDRSEQRFWSTSRRNNLDGALELPVVPRLYQGKATLPMLKQLLQESQSRYRAGPPEGIVIRRENPLWCEDRAKLVRAEFVQAIGEHWRSRGIEWNRVERG